VKLAPFTAEFIMPKLQTSAVAAAHHCSNGDDGNNCGMRWTLNGGWDGSYGVGEQLSALETIQGCLIEGAPPPVTHNTGGTSEGDPNAGGARTAIDDHAEVTKAETVGAAFATVLALGLVASGTIWMILP
jgi:mannan endo-1,6-alpha-mannosidase